MLPEPQPGTAANTGGGNRSPFAAGLRRLSHGLRNNFRPGLTACLPVLIVLLAAAALAADQKIDLLQQKIADLQLLDSELERQVSQAAALKSKLVERKHALEQELVDLNQLLKLRSFRDASQRPRFKYDLKLIAMLNAYIDALVKKIDFYQIGRDKVAFLLQLAEDDIRMLSALSDLRIEALTTQISLLINRYLPEAHAIVIEADDLRPCSPRTVWKKLASGASG